MLQNTASQAHVTVFLVLLKAVFLEARFRSPLPPQTPPSPLVARGGQGRFRGRLRMAIRLARIRPYQRYDHFCQIRGSVTFTVSELWSLLPFWSSHESDGTKSLPPLRSGRNFASEWSRKFGKSPVYFFTNLLPLSIKICLG